MRPRRRMRQPIPRALRSFYYAKPEDYVYIADPNTVNDALLSVYSGSDDEGGTCMPPSVGVYHIRYVDIIPYWEKDEFVGRMAAGLEITADFDIHPIARELLSRPGAFGNGARGLTVALGRERRFEVHRQAGKIRVNKLTLDRFRNFCAEWRPKIFDQDIKVLEWFSAKAMKTEAIELFQNYARQHKTSSYAPQYKWSMFYPHADSPSEKDIHQKQELVADCLEVESAQASDLASFLDDKRKASETHVIGLKPEHGTRGMRGRAGKIIAQEKGLDSKTSFRCTERRHRARDVLGLLISNHEWSIATDAEKLSITKGYLDVIRPPFPCHTSLLQASELWGTLKKWRDNGELDKVAVGDISNADACASNLTGPVSTAYVGFMKLQTGAYDTSIMNWLNQEAWVCFSCAENGDYVDELAGFGDNFAVKNKDGKWKGFPGIIEVNAQDQEIRRILGISLKMDSACGFKVTKDRAKDAISFRHWSGLRTVELYRRPNQNERIAFCIAYNLVPGFSLIDMLAGSLDYKGGGGMSEYLEEELPHLKQYDELKLADAKQVESGQWNKLYTSDGHGKTA